MDRLFLNPKYLKMLYDILHEYCPEAEIWAYGSRIHNDAHAGSDLDLAVKSFNNQQNDLYTLKELLNDSDIPILIDIHEFVYLPDSFKKEIEQDYVVIWNSAINQDYFS